MKSLSAEYGKSRRKAENLRLLPCFLVSEKETDIVVRDGLLLFGILVDDV